MRLIDPPPPFAPLERWRAFKAEMQAILDSGEDDEDVRRNIELANEEIEYQRAQQ